MTSVFYLPGYVTLYPDPDVTCGQSGHGHFGQNGFRERGHLLTIYK